MNFTSLSCYFTLITTKMLNVNLINEVYPVSIEIFWALIQNPRHIALTTW